MSDEAGFSFTIRVDDRYKENWRAEIAHLFLDYTKVQLESINKDELKITVFYFDDLEGEVEVVNLIFVFAARVARLNHVLSTSMMITAVDYTD